MTVPTQTARRLTSKSGLQPSQFLQPQRGVVLIIAMILLVVISLLAITSIRSAGSTANVAGNVRITELATQAAEIALLHCESSILEVMTVESGSPSLYKTTFKLSNISPASSSPKWQDMATWDSTSTAPYVLPLSLVNLNEATGKTSKTYQRPPECMVEPLPVLLAGGTALDMKSSFVVTARGFGPEVEAADASRSRPAGSEVWLQSNITIN